MTTNSAPQFTRAELRRLWKEKNRSERYAKSGLFDFGGYLAPKLRPNKYAPHIGNKQKGL